MNRMMKLPVQQWQALPPATVSGENLPANRDTNTQPPAAPRDDANRVDPYKPLSHDEVNSIFRGDFFERLEESAGDGIRTPARPTIAAPDKPRKVDTPPASPPSPPAPNLAQQNVEQTALLLRKMQGMLDKPNTPPAQADKPKSDEGPFTALIPMDVITVLRGENDKEIQQVMSAIMNTAANMAVLYLERMIGAALVPNLRKEMQQMILTHSKSNEVLTDFARDFPHLNNPYGKLLALKVSEELAGVYKQKYGEEVDKYSLNFLKQVGEVTTDLLKSLSGVDPAAPAGSQNNPPSNGAPPVVVSNNDTKPPRERPPFIADRGARPDTQPPPANNGDDDMADVARAAGWKFQ